MHERVKKLHQAQLRVLVEEQAQASNAGGIQEAFLRRCVRYGLVESSQVDYLVSTYTLPIMGRLEEEGHLRFIFEPDPQQGGRTEELRRLPFRAGRRWPLGVGQLQLG